MVPTKIADQFVHNVIGRYKTRDAVVQPDRPTTQYIVVHHAAADYTPGRACQAIFEFHSSKWPKYGRIGYHEVIQIEPSGSLGCYQVNPPEMQGAGVWGQNEECFHICAATNFGSSVPLQVWQDALALRVAVAQLRYPQAQIVGHQEITLPGHKTECPGTKWQAWKPALLAHVAVLNKPDTKRYRVKGIPVYERQDRTGPVAAWLPTGSDVVIDKAYEDGGVHLASGLGFVDGNALEG